MSHQNGDRIASIPKPSPTPTALLLAWNGGDPDALDALLPLVYEELRRLATHYMKRERSDHPLQATALVNEAYLRLIEVQQVQWQNRVDGAGEPVRLVEGQAANPVWSPDGNLIVYAGRSVIGQVELLGVRPNDGAAVELPHVLVRPGGYRFLPNGSGLVYLPRIQGQDFCLLDFATKTSRPLTRLSNQGALRTFDITPDGKYIVFDRSRQNSNIVLIDLPK